ncbi:MAG: serine/threonine protein kinase, partial [Deltaproteobacteria bacterium]|nr:serine/threonine protein kinase [Deltaproteobacteria bacterium]
MREAHGATSDAALAELVERCVLAFESEGEPAVERLLTAQPALAGVARERFAALRAAGMLLAPSPVASVPLPESIGSYRVLKVLGDGGMGRVYLAEQDAPIRRRVALKVVRTGLDTHEMLARFELERRALALLEHPHIAKIFDAGATEGGQPFFAMEHVAGTPITRYCAEHALPERQRLALFAQVCDAVQHAHQRGILHRDLKPSNILVTERDGQPWPMLIDFGFAKALEPQPDLGSMHTERGRVLGTPEYMSPEQAAHRQDLDTRSDVFSLGVVLYELVTGVLPITSARLRQAGPAELERILREEIPPRPSVAVPRLHGDVDWIVMRAIERDRERRYAMAAELGADLRRFLAGDAVLAGPPSGWYRLSRLARKHRAVVAGAAVVVVTLLAGLIVSVMYAASARRAEVRANLALASAEHSLGKALEAADELLIRVGGEAMRAFPEMAEARRALLESGLRFCESLLAGGASGKLAYLQRADVHLRVANFLDELARREDALRILDAALLLTEAAIGTGPREAGALVMVAALHTKRADVLGLREGWEKPLAAREAALAAARELVAREPGERAERALAEALVWRTHTMLAAERPESERKEAIVEALALIRKIDARALAPDPQLARMLMCMPKIARTLLVRGDPGAAKEVLAETERILVRLRRAAPDDPELLHILAPTIASKGYLGRPLGQVEGALADLEQAEGIYHDLRRRFPGDLRPVAGLAGVHREQG